MALSLKHRKAAVAGAMAGTFTASLHKADGTELAGNGYARVTATVTLSPDTALATFSARFPAAGAGGWPDVASMQLWDSTGAAVFSAPVALTEAGSPTTSLAEAEVLIIDNGSITIE